MKKLSIQKIFCFISILFIASCCIFYGTRFIKLYLANEKRGAAAKNSLAEKIQKTNKENENFKQINDDYYFIKDEEKNYLEYSNILWRIFKITKDNKVLAISESSLTSLAYGQDKSFKDSYVNKWLNTSENQYSGIIETSLNNTQNFLVETSLCLDKVDTIDNKDCQEYDSVLVSLLDTHDYANIGKDSYLINGENFYLVNNTSDNKIWYITSEGKIITSIGSDIIGVRPVITLKANYDYRAGTGTKEDPYIIEDEKGLFGSYVKLDKDIWRIYKVDNDEVKLMLNDYLKINDKYITYQYSGTNSSYNDETSGSIAYYLNNTFLNGLSYKSKLKATKWSNGYYGSTANYDYEEALKTTVSSKVALLSIGDVILNSELKDFYTTTGSALKGTMIYTIKENKKPVTKYMTSALNVVPTISLDKKLLTKGNGTKDSPFEME